MKDLKQLLIETQEAALDYVHRTINAEEQEGDKMLSIEYTDYVDDFVVTFCYKAEYHFEWIADFGDEGNLTIIDKIELTDVILCIGSVEYSILNIVSKW